MTQTPMLKVLAFDVFGTVVDWRGPICAESGLFLEKIGQQHIDSGQFTDDWRKKYLTGMASYAKSGREFTILDVLHREMLEETLRDHGIDPATLDPALLQDWTFAWRRLAPWPGSVEGLTRLKRRFPIVTLSNGNIALMLEMARRGGLPWDTIMGAEVTRAYKPDPRAYLGTAEVLGLAPGDVCLVAAHHSDLAAARKCGLKTAFVARPMEYGGRPAPDAKLEQDWEWSADSLVELADQLGC
ncbi:haloacid dehalogenase type II [Sphingomonas mucosissima]|uniref:(S)-2-haloacid dehalogenase n=1 Tax=Sphingomonas mucosissima TaxID=370959 RepID=A0A245ZJG3_9SPHN|nr:haloacid dehalogenase type II [Sphingomonas mucosissima]OWK29865.1 (S)-2-haloacid dehalogenase [Sphingomonas mucosissima]